MPRCDWLEMSDEKMIALLFTPSLLPEVYVATLPRLIISGLKKYSTKTVCNITLYITNQKNQIINLFEG